MRSDCLPLMINSLPLFHRIEGQPVIVLGTGDAAEAKTRLVRRAGGMVITDMQEGIDKGARLEAGEMDAIVRRLIDIREPAKPVYGAA